jgi:RND family efflux transporter MFP subunit
MIESGQTEQGRMPETVTGNIATALPPETLQDLLIRAQGADRLKIALDLLSTTLAQPRFAAAASAFVTELATRLVCDRVSYGVVRGRRVTVRALSHSAHFTNKSSLFRHIQAAMEEALDQRASVVIPEPPADSPRVSLAHEALAHQFGAGAICSVPLVDAGCVVGVLTLERAADQPFDRSTIDLCESAGALIGPVLEVKRRDDRWLPRKAWDSFLHTLGLLIGPRHMAWKLGTVLLVALAAFLLFAMGDYRVSAKGMLEGAVQQAAVAPYQGYIETAPVRAGDVVRQGQVLLTLQDHDLKLERLKALAQREQFIRERRQALAEREAAKAEILAAQIEQADAQAMLAADKLTRTQIVAPFHGIVVSGDWSQKIGAPIEEGEVLFEIAPLDDYRIVLHVDEHDIAYVREQQHGRLLLTPLPDESFPFQVVKITPVSMAEEGQNMFRVEARLTQPPSERLRPAMEGVGKIDIDRRTWLWIWTHRAVDWVRLKLWAWLP